LNFLTISFLPFCLIKKHTACEKAGNPLSRQAAAQSNSFSVSMEGRRKICSNDRKQSGFSLGWFSIRMQQSIQKRYRHTSKALPKKAGVNSALISKMLNILFSSLKFGSHLFYIAPAPAGNNLIDFPQPAGF